MIPDGLNEFPGCMPFAAGIMIGLYAFYKIFIAPLGLFESDVPPPKQASKPTLPMYQRCPNCGLKGGYTIYKCINRHLYCGQCQIAGLCPQCNVWESEAVGKSID